MRISNTIKDKASGSFSFSATQLCGVYTYIFCLVLSQVLLGSPIFGGVMLLFGQIASFLASTKRLFLSVTVRKRARTLYIILMLILAVLLAGLIVIFPGEHFSVGIWSLLAMEILIYARDILSRRLMNLLNSAGITVRKYVICSVSVEIVAVGVAWLALRNNTPTIQISHSLLIGFSVSCALQLYCQLRFTSFPMYNAQLSIENSDNMLKSSALKKFETLSALLFAALVVTLVLAFTYIFISSDVLPQALGLSLCATIGAWEISELLFRRQQRSSISKTTDMSNLLLLGIAFWLFGIISFMSNLKSGSPTFFRSTVSLCLVATGATLCASWIGKMQSSMENVVEFTTGNTDFDSFHTLHMIMMQSGLLLGQVISLIALCVPVFSSGTFEFHPLMLIPVFVMVVSSLLLALRLPLNRRYMEKLARFLTGVENGSENTSLKNQLEEVVVRRHTQPFLVRFLTAIVRKILNHKLINPENIIENPDNPVIFLCNHGEMYGPVAAMANIPVDVRPWTMSELTADRDEMSQYFYKWTVSQQKWIPKRLQMPIARFIAPICLWGMNQLESIPVYRNKLRELMKTFRLSVDALTAGDNLLIFPENPNFDYEGEGYKLSGVGEFYSGFAMLAPIYYSKTGKCARFLPMFCHSASKKIFFGTEIVYNPDADPMAERDRLVSEAHQQMVSMWEAAESCN